MSYEDESRHDADAPPRVAAERSLATACRALVLVVAIVSIGAGTRSSPAPAAGEDGGELRRSLELEESAPLASFVPAGVAFFVGWESPPDGSGAARSLAPVARSLEKAFRNGALADLARLLLVAADGTSPSWLESLLDLLARALPGPSWGELGGGGVACAVRLTGPIPELLVLFRPRSGDIARHAADVRRVLGRLASEAPTLLALEAGLEEDEAGARLSLAGTPLALEALRIDSLLALSTSRLLLRESLELARGIRGDPSLQAPACGGTGEPLRSLAADPRFAALGGTKETGKETGSFGTLFIDLRATFELISRWAGATAETGGTGSTPADPTRAELIRALFDELQFLELAGGALAASESSGLEWHGRVTFDPDLARGPLARSWLEQEPAGGIVRRLPEDCPSVIAWSGWNLLRLTDALDGLLRWRVPGARGFSPASPEDARRADLWRDIAAWADGGGAWVEVSRTEPDGEGTALGRALVLRLAHQLRAERRIAEILAASRETAAAWGQDLSIEAVDWNPRFSVIRTPIWPEARWCLGSVAGALVVAGDEETARRICEAWEDGAGAGPAITSRAIATGGRGSLRALGEIHGTSLAQGLATVARRLAFWRALGAAIDRPEHGGAHSRAVARVLTHAAAVIESLGELAPVHFESRLDAKSGTLELNASVGESGR